MNLRKSVELMGKYAVCPECGNDKIGGGAGTLVIEDNTFERTCKCGWSVKEEVQPTERG
jgi:hypothetical protein